MITVKFNSQRLRRLKASTNREVKRAVGETVQEIVTLIHETAHARTPVYEGRAVANFQWSENTPFTDEIEPVGSQPPGKTSDMELGEEPRRPENKAISDASLKSINFRRAFLHLFLRNNVSYFPELEYGQSSPSHSSRTPAGGILRAAIAEVRALMPKYRKTIRLTVKN